MSESENGDRPERPGRQLIADAVAARKRAQMVTGLRGLTKPRPPYRIAAPSGASPSGAAVASSNGTALPGGSAAPSSYPPGTEFCYLCGLVIPEDHRHLLASRRAPDHLLVRGMLGDASRGGRLSAGGQPDAMGLPDLQIPDDVWAGFQIPIGLAFFMHSTVTSCVVAMYPSPAGATGSSPTSTHGRACARSTRS